MEIDHATRYDAAMRYTDLTSRSAVLRAIAECDRLGRDKFLAEHGYAPAKEYILRHNGKEYDSKAIVGVAYGHQHGCSPLVLLCHKVRN